MPDAIHKTFEIKLLDKRPNGGRIMITTGSPDRQHDRVMPLGLGLTNYQKNPIVQWGHNYKDPFATIGRTTALTVSDTGIVADFELRPAANDADPQNIVLLLWDGEWIKTASIGFIPLVGKANEIGGSDFMQSELLEWSLVPIPANAEALRLAYKSLGGEIPGVLLTSEPDVTIISSDDDLTEPATSDAPPVMRAWIRKVQVETDAVRSHYANFMLRTVAVPDDATVLVMDDALGECTEQPHPERGQTVTFKMVLFVPPLQLANGHQVYTIERREEPDESLMAHELWKINETSDIVDWLPAEDVAKAAGARFDQLLPVDIITDKVFSRALELTKRLHRHALPTLSEFENAFATLIKPTDSARSRLRDVMDDLDFKAGRVLSRKNENKIIEARDKLNEVLNEVAEQEPAPDEPAKTLSIPCPFCQCEILLLSWGMYSCEVCGGTFEVVPESGDLHTAFPQKADVIAVEAGAIAKGAIPGHTTPKADPDMAWDAGAVLRAAPNDRRVLRRIHAWVDAEGDPDAKGSYKFPHHLVDGRVVLRGVNNGKARLSGSSIPGGDKPGVEAHLNRHQRQFQQAEALRDYARALLEVAAELDGDHHLSDEDERALVDELRTLTTLVQEAMK